MDPRTSPLRTIGRYLVLEEQLPDGARRIFLALDPYLMRRLSIELHPDAGEEERLRMREAQAIGRLRHPNVLAVHDAGTCDAGTYIAREYASGITLADWLAKDGRGPLRPLLDHFRGVTEALLAAHASDLVHDGFRTRDVLIGSDGAPRLTGLRTSSETQRSEAQKKDRRELCAAIAQALQGRRIPRALRRLLQDDAAELFTLALALRPPQRRWLRWVAPLFLLLAIALFATRYRAAVCGGAEYRLGELFSAAQQDAVREALRRLGRAEAVAPLVTRIAAFRSSWLGEYHAACAATRIQSTQREEDMELRLGCLSERAAELRATIDVLASADENRVVQALAAVGVVTDLEGCRDLPALRSRTPLPRDASLRPRVAALREKLASVQGLHDAGGYREALALLAPILDETQALGFAPLSAEALYHKGRVLRMSDSGRAAEEIYFAAATAAEAGRHDLLLANIFISLMYVVGVQQGRFAEGRELARYASAALARCTDHRTGWDNWHRQFGTLLLLSGDHAGALEHYQQISQQAIAPSPGHLDLENNRGLALLGLGRLIEARASFERSLALRQAQFGAAHPSLFPVLDSLGQVLEREGRCEERLRLAERQLERCQRLGAEHPYRGMALIGHGRALWQLGRSRQAEPELREGLRILEQAYGAQHPDLVQGLSALAQIQHHSGRTAEARTTLDHGRRLLSQHTRDPDAALTELSLARSCRDAPQKQ